MQYRLVLMCAALVACSGDKGGGAGGDGDSGAPATTPTGATGTATAGPGGTATATGGPGTGGPGTGTGTATGGETGDTGTATGGTTGTTPVGGPCTTTVDVCATGACVVDLAPTSVTVLGQVLYDGIGIMNDGDGDDFQIVFVDPTGEETVYASPGGPTLYEAVIYPSVYDVFFELLDTTGTVAVPAQGRLLIAEGIDLTEDANLDVLPAPLELAGSISYDGGGIPRGDGAVWAITVHDLDADEWYTYPKAGGTGVYDVGVWPGTYDVYFEILDKAVLPRSVEGRTLGAAGVEVLTDSVADLVLDTVTVQGSVRWDGAPPRDDADGAPNFAIYFDDKLTGQRLQTVLPDGVSFYQSRLYPGEYEVWTELLDVSDTVSTPVGGAWRYTDTLVVAPPAGSLEIGIETVRLTGEIQYDASLILGADELADWSLTFTEVDTGSTFTRRYVGGRPTYEADVLPGVYDVDFALLDPTSVLRPIDASARVAEALDLTATATLDLELVPATVSGTIMYDGALIGRDDAGSDYELVVTNRVTGDTVAKPLPGGEGEYVLYALPGVYDVDFELIDVSGPVLFPATGRFAAARALAVSGDTVLDITPTTVLLSGSVTYDGLPVQAGPDREWQVVLTSRDIATIATHPKDGGITDWEVSTYPGVWNVGFELLDGRAVLNPVLGGTHVDRYCADIR